MNFNEALDAINSGLIVQRKKWMDRAKIYIVRNKLNNINHIEARTKGSCIMYGASSEDLLADDWEIMNQEIEPKQKWQDEIVL